MSILATKSTLAVGDVSIIVTRKQTLKNLYVKILPPDGEVLVNAPAHLTDKELTNFLLGRMPEIYKHRQQMRSQPRQAKREFVSGEAHYLWGKPYKLQVVYGATRASVVKQSGKLIMNVPEGYNEKQREHVLTEWYRQELKRVLGSALSRCEKRVGVSANDCRIKNMRTRWGTCNITERRIWVNLQLVKKPAECLDYVLTHELVHLLEKNHTARFYELVERYFPTWREADAQLKEMPLDHLDKEAAGGSTTEP